MGQSEASGNEADEVGSVEDEGSVEEGSVDGDAVDWLGAHRRPSLPLFLLTGVNVDTAGTVTVDVTVLTTVVV